MIEGGPGEIMREVERIKASITRRWLKTIGLLGAGLLPCPDCGGPLITHLWPLVLLLSVRKLFQHKNAAFRQGSTPKDLRENYD